MFLRLINPDNEALYIKADSIVALTRGVGIRQVPMKAIGRDGKRLMSEERVEVTQVDCVIGAAYLKYMVGETPGQIMDMLVRAGVLTVAEVLEASTDLKQELLSFDPKDRGHH